MNKRLAIGLGVIIGLVAVSASVSLSVYLAWRQSFDSQRAAAGAIASDVLRRSETSTDETLAIIRAMKQVHAPDPCSPENIRRMGKLDLGSDQIQAVGYVRNDHLLCSSYGRHDMPVGSPMYTTPYGIATRSDVEFPIYPGLKLLLVTDVQSGYSTAILANRPLDVFTNDPGIALSVFSTVSRKTIISRNAVKQEWLDRLGERSSVEFIDGDQLVALRRSARYALVACAAIPAARVKAGLRHGALTLVPVGALAGLSLALAIGFLVRQQLSMRSLIRAGLRRHEFFLEYQPIMDLRDGRCVGAEALIRWRRSDRQIVRPDLFIPAAEDAGLISAITKRVMDLVAQDAAQLLRLRPELHIAINLSAHDLQTAQTSRLVRELVGRMHAQPQNLMVEATERGFMLADAAHRVMGELRDSSIRIAIDDFGTGYSSLSYLQKFKLDYLKIDKSFVDTMGGEAATSQVAHHIIEMAKSLNLEMIAEGVETPAQLQYLKQRGVQYAQGWLFSRSLPFDQFASFVARMGKPGTAAESEGEGTA